MHCCWLGWPYKVNMLSSQRWPQDCKIDEAASMHDVEDHRPGYPEQECLLHGQGLPCLSFEIEQCMFCELIGT